MSRAVRDVLGEQPADWTEPGPHRVLDGVHRIALVDTAFGVAGRLPWTRRAMRLGELEPAAPRPAGGGPRRR